ncbi:hypothetical protein V5O48_018703 [Marasmius crinis-equi]|uniref:Uncharacterized protein n=1 Tax=Marasmius crinis-equi TaxID=585013 RepID=A0ABR3EKJ4_9AGAR
MHFSLLIHPDAVTTTSSTQSPPAVSTSSVVTKTSHKMNGALHTEAELEERIVLTSESIARSASTFTHPSPMRPPTTLTEAHKTSSRESIVGNRRSINGKTGKTVKREGGFSAKHKAPQTTQSGSAQAGLKDREITPQGMASRVNVHSRSPPKATFTSPNLRMSNRTPGNAASRVPARSMPSVSIPQPKRPETRPRESSRVYGSITRDDAKPGVTSGKAISASSRAPVVPLSSEPTHTVSPLPSLRTPQNTAMIPASARTANTTRVSRPRTEWGPAFNAGTPARQSQRDSGIEYAGVSTESMLSASTTPLEQPQDSTRVHRSVTGDAAKPGVTSRKATPASSPPNLRRPRSAAITSPSPRSINPSASAARISRPRAEPSRAPCSGIEGNDRSPGTQNTTKTPSKGVQ